MPELPDVAAYISALEPRIVGRPLQRVRVASVSLLRTADPPLAAVEGRVVRELRRIGKRIAIGLDGDLWLVLHLMIAGRLHWRPAGAKLSGRRDLAAFDFPDGTLVLTEAGTKRRASLHVVRGEEALNAMDPGGIDVFAADLDAFRAALTRREPHAQSARSPIRASSTASATRIRTRSSTPRSSRRSRSRTSSHREQWQRLYDATRATLQHWIDRLRDEAAGEFPEHVTAFRKDMAVHGRFGQPCPRCGEPVQRIRYADNETNYCARCQTGGALLADRSLSRLLKGDWPRTLEELDALKRR